MKPNNWINPRDDYAICRAKQVVGYRTGSALQSHINTCHGGQVSDTCPACKEIQRKMEAAK